MAKLKDMASVRRGRVTALTRDGTSTDGVAMWTCRCDCGNTLRVRGADLRRKDNKGVRSCGCLRSPYVRRHIAKELPDTPRRD